MAGVGAGGDDEDLTDAGVGDEDLGAIEQVVVALVHGGGGGPAGVAARPRLGQPEPAEHLAPTRAAGRSAASAPSVPKSTMGEVPRLVWAQMVRA